MQALISQAQAGLREAPQAIIIAIARAIILELRGQRPAVKMKPLGTAYSR